jgi:beta-phosphoglucomutase-like phosphatase (HAD superfamily)
MPIHAMIFDIDGTLIDTNPAHVEAWRRTFQLHGFDVPAERIVVEIGKGGNKLIPSVLGQQIEERDGDAHLVLAPVAELALQPVSPLTC